MKIGEDLVRCQPFAQVVLQKVTSSICDGCFKKAPPDKRYNRCSGCKFVYYCGSTCQRQCWPSHRDECKYLKSVAPKIPTDTVRLMARIILKLQSGGLRAFDILPDGTKRGFDGLMSHQKEIVRDSKRMEAFDSFFHVLQDCLGESLPPKPEILDIYGKILINSFNIMDDEYQPIGIGIYLAGSVLDHSCRPTANVVFQGKELLVRSIQETISSDLSQVRISYTNLLSTNEERKKELKAQYYFDCTCESCSNDNNDENLLKIGAILCPVCSASIPTALKQDSCVNCQEPLSEVFEAHEVLSQEVQKIISENVGNPANLNELCREYYSRMVSVFSPCDKMFLDVLENLYEDSIANQEWDRALDFSQKLLVGYQRLYPEYGLNTGLLLMKLAKLACYLNKFQEAERYLHNARKILSVTHGEKHPLYSEVLDPLLREVDLVTKGHGEPLANIDQPPEITKSG